MNPRPSAPFVAFVFDPAAQTVTRIPIPPTRFAVQTRFFPDQWENCWTVDGAPLTFATRAEAQAELDAHLADIADAVAAGDMIDGYDPADFRIVEVRP